MWVRVREPSVQSWSRTELCSRSMGAWRRRGRWSLRPSLRLAPCGWAATPDCSPRGFRRGRWSFTCFACGRIWTAMVSVRMALWLAGTPNSGVWPVPKPKRRTRTCCVVRAALDYSACSETSCSLWNIEQHVCCMFPSMHLFLLSMIFHWNLWTWETKPWKKSRKHPVDSEMDHIEVIEMTVCLSCHLLQFQSEKSIMRRLFFKLRTEYSKKSVSSS